MKYKVGDKVRIKSLGWYKENKDKFNNVWTNDGQIPFDKHKSKWCGKVMTISDVRADHYTMIEDLVGYWADEMIEGLVEKETKFGTVSNPIEPKSNAIGLTQDRVNDTKPEPKFKVGDKIISDVFSTKDDKGWKVIDVERTGYKLISVNNPDLICDMDFKNEYYYKLVEEKCDYVQVDNIPDVIQSKTSSVCSHNGFYGYSDSDGNETSEWYLPDGYEFRDENGNVINATKIVLEKKKKEYPKTYEECRKIVDYALTGETIIGYKATLLRSFQKLLICRDAYWKIAGDEMGLGKPWVPDNDYNSPPKYIISCYIDDIIEEKYRGQYNRLLSFPTEEMRDAFKENFKKLIEECKELL